MFFAKSVANPLHLNQRVASKTLKRGSGVEEFSIYSPTTRSDTLNCYVQHCNFFSLDHMHTNVRRTINTQV